MSRMRAFRSVLALVIALVLLRAVPAYPWHGSGNITALAITPQRATTLYAGTSDRGVFKSTDGGASWSATGLTNIWVTALAIDPQTPSTVYAGTGGGGVFKTADGGGAWSVINNGLTDLNVADLAVDPQTTQATLYALISGAGVFKSTTGGDSWTPTALMDLVFLWDGYFPATVTVQTLAIAPRVDPATPATLYAGVTYVTSDAFNDYVWGEVFKSTDGGASWAGIGPGDPWTALWGSAPTLAVAPPTPTTPTTLYTSGSYEYPVCWIRDESATFDCARLTDTFVAVSLVVDPQTPTTIYAGTDLGVYKSTDAGASWSAVSTGLTDLALLTPDVRALAIDPMTPPTLYAGTGVGVFKSTDGGANWNPTGLIRHSPLSSVSLSPSVIGGTASTGTVSLLTPAPEGGAVVTLSSSNPAVATVPASVTVPAGATSANFTVSTGAVTASTTVTISAAFDDTTMSVALTVTPPLAYVVLNPNGVAGGIASTGFVALGAPAPVGGAVVTLSSSNTALATVPPNVTVAAGATSANFTVFTSAVTASTTVTITGAYGGDTKSAVLTVVPTTLSSLSLNPRSVPAGSASTGTVTLSVPAPAGGAVVTLSSKNTAVATVPASVTVAAGATSANFTVSTNSVLPPTYSSIIEAILGTYGGVTRYDYLQVTLPPATTLSSLSLNPTSVTIGSTSTGTVTLTAPAPAGGAVVTLSSSAPTIVTIPASVTVAAGTTSASFTVSTGSLNACTSAAVTISGTYNGVTRSADLTIAPATVDTINIQQTDYFASRHELRVAAKSSNSSATLRVYVTSTGELIGTLTKGGDGTYRGQFTWPVNPQNITVRSSLCGSATSSVRSK